MNGERQLAYRLALATGCPNPDAMLSHMPYRVWVEWVQYMGIEPFGEERADARIGILSALFANAWLRKSGAPLFEPSDFMPFIQKKAPSQPISKAQDKTPDELYAIVSGLNKAFGGVEVHQDASGISTYNHGS